MSEPVCVMVAGMHRSGTSMVAQVLEGLGVIMGDRQLGSNEFNPKGHTEDADFFEINVRVLHAAGGSWLEVPQNNQVEKVFPWFLPRLRFLIDWKSNRYRRWGVKDPRFCLTGHLLWPYLPDPKVVVVTERTMDDTADSLDRRARSVGYPTEEDLDASPSLWYRLIHEYVYRRKPLLTRAGDSVVRVDVDRLWESYESALEEIEKLAERVGGDPTRAAQRIIFR